jgi:hypothetical protein
MATSFSGLAERARLIPPTTSGKPASIQEHKSYFYDQWEDSDFPLGFSGSQHARG